MAKLSTHVLDTVHGRPAAGVLIELFALDGASARLLTSTRTNSDGRSAQPLLEGTAVIAGRYRLVFHIGEYFRANGVTLAEPPFVDAVPVEFGLEAGRSYHVPLLCSPWSYSTYRGS